MLDKKMTPGLCALAVWSSAWFSDYPDISVSALVCYIWLRMHLSGCKIKLFAEGTLETIIQIVQYFSSLKKKKKNGSK